ncbi:interferon alpha-inducible protein 27-like protein 2 [Elgaria multicarinata webbii]|uniref:interferon alpha-inducible protein 27-like protein 2 n=1 Tax=Elgaria multicarinata webbii TaxID=159646 RepID=UPI002FCD4926
MAVVSSSTVVLSAIAGLGVATIAIPAAVGAMGFTGAGITSGSLAAKMMSLAAIANGGKVAAGSVVAVLQSIGAAGLSAAAKTAITAGAALLPAFFR